MVEFCLSGEIGVSCNEVSPGRCLLLLSAVGTKIGVRGNLNEVTIYIPLNTSGSERWDSVEQAVLNPPLIPLRTHPSDFSQPIPLKMLTPHTQRTHPERSFLT